MISYSEMLLQTITQCVTGYRRLMSSLWDFTNYMKCICFLTGVRFLSGFQIRKALYSALLLKVIFRSSLHMCLPLVTLSYHTDIFSVLVSISNRSLNLFFFLDLYHCKSSVGIIPTLSSLEAPKVVTAIPGATRGDKVGIMTIFGFLWCTHTFMFVV